jgi:hypothetical protein
MNGKKTAPTTKGVGVPTESVGKEKNQKGNWQDGRLSAKYKDNE